MGKDVIEDRWIVIKVMYCVGVIPHDSKIRPGDFWDVCQSFDGVIGINVSGRVGIFRDAPDTFNAGVGRNQVFDLVHIGTTIGQPNVN